LLKLLEPVRTLLKLFGLPDLIKAEFRGLQVAFYKTKLWPFMRDRLLNHSGSASSQDRQWVRTATGVGSLWRKVVVDTARSESREGRPEELLILGLIHGKLVEKFGEDYAFTSDGAARLESGSVESTEREVATSAEDTASVYGDY